MKTLASVFRWIFRLALLGVVIYALSGVAFYYLTRPAEPPKLEEAPWVIQTFSQDVGTKIPSRFYFAEKVAVLKDGTPQATNWWSYDGRGYTKHDGVLLLPKSLYGNVDIKRRKE